MKEACLQLGEKFYDQEEHAFEKLITITFDHTVEDVFSAGTKAEYRRKIKALDTMGGTNFVPVLDKVSEVIKDHPNVNEVFVMFVSDGQDGRQPSDPDTLRSIQKIQSLINVETTFLTVGFSCYHDASKMN